MLLFTLSMPSFHSGAWNASSYKMSAVNSTLLLLKSEPFLLQHVRQSYRTVDFLPRLTDIYKASFDGRNQTPLQQYLASLPICIWRNRGFYPRTFLLLLTRCVLICILFFRLYGFLRTQWGLVGTGICFNVWWCTYPFLSAFTVKLDMDSPLWKL